MGEVAITKTTTRTTCITQVGVDFIVFDESYRRIRQNHRYQGFCCYQCNKHFQDGDKISLAIANHGNKVLCHDCGVKIQSKLEGKLNE